MARVFVHRPRRDVGRPLYERALARFHAGPARTPPPGFRESVALRLPAARITGPTRLRVGYAVEGFRALDPIREVAYRLPGVRTHRAIARRAADGWGAVYPAPYPAGPPGPRDRLVWYSSSALTVFAGAGTERGGSPSPPVG